MSSVACLIPLLRPDQSDHETNTGIKTREKLKEAYDAEFIATIERAEKQIILARHGRRLLQLLDDSPVVPGEAQRAYHHGAQARQILNDCEDDMKDWEPELDVRRYEVAQDEQLPSPTTSTTPLPQNTTTTTGTKPVEFTPVDATQGEHKSALQRPSTAEEGDSVSGVAFATGQSQRSAYAKMKPQSLQHQLDGSTMLLSNSPISSADG